MSLSSGENSLKLVHLAVLPLRSFPDSGSICGTLTRYIAFPLPLSSAKKSTLRSQKSALIRRRFPLRRKLRQTFLHSFRQIPSQSASVATECGFLPRQAARTPCAAARNVLMEVPFAAKFTRPGACLKREKSAIWGAISAGFRKERSAKAPQRTPKLHFQEFSNTHRARNFRLSFS